MSDRYIAEIKVTKIEYAGDHDRETIVVATSAEADTTDLALNRVFAKASGMSRAENEEQP